MNKKISSLKASNLIDNNANVPNSLVKYLDVEIKLTDEINEEMSLRHARELIMHLYLKDKLGLTKEELKKIAKGHICRLRHRSLDSLVKVVDVLQNKLELSNDRIKKNAFLLYSCTADTINELLTEVPVIAGVPMKEILNSRLMVAVSSAEQVKAIIKHVQSFDIPEKRLLNCFEIFTLSPNTVYDRLVQLTKIKEFDVLKSHPRVLLLIYYHNKARIRLDFLKELKVKCVSLNTLTSDSENFESYVFDGADKTSGHDTVLCVAEQLNKEYDWVKANFKGHSNWHYVPVIAVIESIEYLRAKGFSDDDISLNIHLLLYPVSKIEQKLIPLLKKKENNGSHKISGVPISEIPNSKILSLCLYYIEVEFHFSGDGIWDSSKQDR